MPYRVATMTQPCAVCEAPTDGACRRCRAPLCPRHSTRFEFYVSTIQCTDAAMCKPFVAPEVDTRREAPDVVVLGVVFDRWR